MGCPVSRVTHRPVFVMVVVAVLIAGCGSPGLSASASPPVSALAGLTAAPGGFEPSTTPGHSTPTSMASPSLTPLPSGTTARMAAGWPVSGMSGAVIGHDGTVFAWMADDVDSQPLVAALDVSGRMRPGWPFRVTSPGSGNFLVVATDGTLLVAGPDETGAGFELHRVGADGRETTGWPYRDEGSSYCSVVAADGAIVLGCARRDGGGSTIVMIDAAGEVIPGWPVALDGVERLDSAWGAAVQLGPDGTVYALGTLADRGEMARLWALAPDGTPRQGFPVTLESRAAGYLLARDRVLVGSYIPPEVLQDGLCSESASTAVIAELDTAGRIVPGWPRTAAGWVSRPAIGAEGTIYYLARDRLFARGPDGSALPGWPVAVSPVYPECADYGPYLAPDGTIYVIDGGLAAYGPDGHVRPGWPFEPDHGFAGWFCTMDTVGGTIPVLGPDGRVYAAIAGASGAGDEPGPLQVVELDPTGRVMPGWPYTLPGTGPGEVELLGVVDGRLYVSLSRCGTSDASTALLALDADGSLSD